MKLIKAIGTGLSLTVLCLLVAPNARADDGKQKTTVTFTDPVEVPGVGQHLLPPGTYVFRLKNSPADRHIVEISNQDETKVLTTLISIPDFRLKATDKPILTFSQRAAGEPEALKGWFNGSQKSGEQFVWERSKAIQFAKETNEPVLSTNVEFAAGPVEALNTAPVEAVNPMGQTVETAAVVEAPPVEMAAAAPAPVIAPQPMPVATVAAPVTPDSTPVTTVATPAVPEPTPITAESTPVASDPTPISTVATPSVPDPAPAATVPAPVSPEPTPVATAATPVAPEPTTAAVEATPVVQEPTPVAHETATAASFPATASELPLIGLTGLLSLAGGFLMLGLLKRRV